jgi:hypothetical protein
MLVIGPIARMHGSGRLVEDAWLISSAVLAEPSEKCYIGFARSEDNFRAKTTTMK